MGLLRRLGLSAAALFGGIALAPVLITAGWVCAITDGIISTIKLLTAPIALSLEIAFNRNHVPIQLAEQIPKREPLLSSFGLTKRLISITYESLWKIVFHMNARLIATAPRHIPMPPVSTLALEADHVEFLKA